MKTLTILGVSSLLTLAACATPENGYYDAYGNFRPYNMYNAENHTRPPIPNGNEHYAPPPPPPPYAALHVPTDLLPPRGMCRVWFVERTPAYQPPLESCDTAEVNVPAGAYIIYGG